MCVPDQPIASTRLFRVPTDRRRCNALFEPIQLRYKFLDFLLDVLGMLGTPVLGVHDGHSLDPYLIMPDERVHAAQGGLEGREPVGGFFRNIEEYFYAICYPLPLCWAPPSHQ